MSAKRKARAASEMGGGGAINVTADLDEMSKRDKICGESPRYAAHLEMNAVLLLFSPPWTTLKMHLYSTLHTLLA